MKIALVSPYDWSVPGGVNSHVRPLAAHLLRCGHSVRIVAPSSRPALDRCEQLTIIGASVIGLPASGSVANVCISFNLGPRVKKLLEREEFDVVHLHEPFMPLLPFQFLRYSRATNVATFHAAREGGSRLYAYSRHIIRPWWGRIHGRIAHSRAALRLIGKHFPARYRIIPSGVDCALFAQAKPIRQYMDGKKNILFLGRLEKRKGLPFLLEAYAGLKKEMPDIRLIVVGGDGGLRPACERYVERNGLADVVFAGYVPDEDKPRYFKTADIYCAPNTGAESLGIVLLEAMAAGTPMVASSIEGFADVLTDGDEGLLVTPRDSEELRLALKRLLRDAGLREEMGKQAAVTAQQYSWERTAGQVLQYYEETIAAGGAP
ncbi:MAG TPA: glycosyltransferase family 4 protein [Dehalococcoidia bacterium]|nr:glycosyltransferase family 4 protein [Dehalococcoidia bacterium]